MGIYFFDKKIIIISVTLAACLYMVVFPEITIRASKTAIDIWLNSIVPVIMPFFIAAGFLKRIGVCNSLPVRIYPFAMAVLSGYPMGAKISGDYYRDGQINEKELYSLLSYSMVTGPAFIVGTVGVSLLNSYAAGVALALSHYASAVINGLIYGGTGLIKTGTSHRELISSDNQSYYNILTDSILETFKSMAIILAYIMLFMIICVTVSETEFFSSNGYEYGEALITGIMEMTVGCGKMSAVEINTLYLIPGVSFMISFGGLSVLGQSMSMLKNCPVKAPALMKIKFSHGLISAIISFVIYKLMVV